MMKATAWFCPVLLTLLSATRLVCTAQRGAAATTGGAEGGGAAAAAAVAAAAAALAAGSAGYANGYPLDYLDAQTIQDEYSLVKRNKPSLSIVNPLDVLRQRLLLEIARRQMKENTRQVELNRAILKNVGKRVFLEPATWGNTHYQQHQQQLERQQEAWREQLRREQLQQQHFPSQLWRFGWPQSTTGTSTGTSSVSGSGSGSGTPSASSHIFDFLQQPATRPRQQTAAQQLLDDTNKSLNTLGTLGLGVAKHPQQQQQQPEQTNGNEIANETNHENGHRKSLPVGKSATGVVNDEDADPDEEQDQDDLLDDLNLNWGNEQSDDLESVPEAANANGQLPWHLIYRVHKNPHYAN
ncbi:uncharacterized protein LOC6563003 [Drosophila grimshawi]|nr:uncharacterized protein LOC6563003 [Drosophila grimshawi]EDV93440.1 GH18271 [Drosophila grimshawi]